MNKEVAKILLNIEAVHLSPDHFFTWTSGLKSPIYCDNRQIISYPEQRKYITQKFSALIKEKYPETQVIAGTATAGIPWAAWIADELGLPMIYIRSNAKGHGLKNALEGKAIEGQKAIVIEDLISTGKSSIAAAKEITSANMQLQGVLSIFNYGFDFAHEAFEKSKISYDSLCNLPTMLEYAKEEDLLTESQIAIIEQWKNSTKLN